MSTPSPNAFGPPGAQPATAVTRACQHAARRWLPLADTRSFDDARRGHVADLPRGAITRANGAPVWNLDAYGFLADDLGRRYLTPAIALRLLALLPTGLTLGALHTAAGAWVLAFALYLWRFFPMMIRPRIDVAVVPKPGKIAVRPRAPR